VGNDNTLHLSLGVLALCFPLPAVQKIIDAHGRGSKRMRDLPAAVMAYYIIGISLFPGVGYEAVLRWLLCGLQWLGSGVFRISTKGALSRARQKLGEEPLRQMFEQFAQPIGRPDLLGCCWKGLHVVAIDGSTLALQDTEANEQAFGRSSNQNGPGAYPLARFVVLAEAGSHIIFAAELGSYHESEVTLASRMIGKLQPGMLCLADRLFPGRELWSKAAATGAHLLWRAKSRLRLERIQTLQDGSWLARWKNSKKRHDPGILVRVVEYQLKGGEGETYRLLTTLLDPAVASADELAAFYPQRWEVELTIKEGKSTLRQGALTLRSKKPELVRQEFFGLLLAHYAVRKMMALAALGGNKDPDELSFQNSAEVIRTRQAGPGRAFPPSTPRGEVPERNS
jgi:hypothetical protein